MKLPNHGCPALARCPANAQRPAALTLPRLALTAALTLAALGLLAAEPTIDELLFQARTARANGKLDEALALVNKAIEREPKNPKTHFLRAALYESDRQHAKAIADYTEVLRLEPRASQAWQNRGNEHFLIGKFKEAVADYDKFLELQPRQAPQHWQRGIACYYAGLFEEGRKQFELHQTVNSHDVENAVWHFLCVARLEGVEKARAKLIDIHDDTRVPMMKVHALFAGKAKPEDVLAAVKEKNPPADELGHRTFYANLYLGLYYEGTGNAALAREHILKADELAADNGFMGSVAKVHANLLRPTGEKGAAPK
jgi:lipoprotein NlpI